MIDELGTGLATRGSDLNAVIRRANPALGETDKVFKILASQNRQLAQLADDSQTVLAPLAKERDQISGFIRSANTTSVAVAARAQDESQTFHLFPTFLSQLRPLLADLSVLADQGTPVLQQLGQTAGPLGTEFGALAPFATEARTSLIALGHTAQQSEAPLVSSLPVVQQLKSVGVNAKPSAASLEKLLSEPEHDRRLRAADEPALQRHLGRQRLQRRRPLRARAAAEPRARPTTRPSCAAGGCSSAHFQHDVDRAAGEATGRRCCEQQRRRQGAAAPSARAPAPRARSAGLLSYLTGRGAK